MNELALAVGLVIFPGSLVLGPIWPLLDSIAIPLLIWINRPRIDDARSVLEYGSIAELLKTNDVLAVAIDTLDSLFIGFAEIGDVHRGFGVEVDRFFGVEGSGTESVFIGIGVPLANVRALITHLLIIKSTLIYQYIYLCSFLSIRYI